MWHAVGYFLVADGESKSRQPGKGGSSSFPGVFMSGLNSRAVMQGSFVYEPLALKVSKFVCSLSLKLTSISFTSYVHSVPKM